MTNLKVIIYEKYLYTVGIMHKSDKAKNEKAMTKSRHYKVLVHRQEVSNLS
jgi:hypothetical protein